MIAALALAASLATSLGGSPVNVPESPDAVVMEVPRRAADVTARSQALEEQHARANPAAATALARRLIERARAEREPRFFGRAESLLQPWTSRGTATTEMLVLHADILQNRHDFIAALALLDRAVDQDPLAIRARLMRATVLLVRGEPLKARTDCAAIFSYGESTLGSVCLAQVLASRGELEHAAELVRVVSPQGSTPPDIEGWIQGTLADFAMRSGDAEAAEIHLRAALAAQPQDETLRIQLSDLLLARRAAPEALRLTDLPKPTIGLLVRRYLAQAELRDAARVQTLVQLRELIDLEVRRNEHTHLREEALLALSTGASTVTTLELARANFALQREAIDVRLYARAATYARDARALRELNDWCTRTGFRDREVQALLSREQA